MAGRKAAGGGETPSLEEIIARRRALLLAEADEISKIRRPICFDGLIDNLRNRLPARFTQSDGHAGRYTDVDGTDEYVEIISADLMHRYAAGGWWGKFRKYMREQGGTKIVWRVFPEYFTKQTSDGSVEHRIYGRVFVNSIHEPLTFPLTVPRMKFETARHLKTHLETYRRLLEQWELREKGVCEAALASAMEKYQ